MMNALTPWLPQVPGSLFREFGDVRRDFDALFDSVFRNGGQSSSEGTRVWWPSVESYTKDGKLYVRCDLPGVDPKDVEVSLTGNTLTIQGERKAEQENAGYREVQYGRFERRLTVPQGIDPEKISARYHNGLLEISVPLPAELTGRKVPVEIEHQSESGKKAA